MKGLARLKTVHVVALEQAWPKRWKHFADVWGEFSAVARRTDRSKSICNGYAISISYDIGGVFA